MCEPGQFEELLQALALEQERLLRRADEEHQAWRRTLQESFRCLTQRELAQEGASEVFAQLLDVRPGDQPILPEDIDPVPICLDCLDCLDSESSEEEKVSKVLSVTESRASGRGPSPQSVAELRSLMSDDSNHWFRCTIFPWLDYVAGIAVLLNTILMLAQLELDGRAAAVVLGLESRDFTHTLQVMQGFEASFVFFYIVELLLRIWVERLSFFKDVPNLFDCGLVILGIVDVVVSSPFDGVKSPVEDQPSLKLMRSLKSMRALRLVRTFRFVRGLRLLVTACKCFIPSLFWSMVLLAVFMTMGALTLGTTLQTFITDDAVELDAKLWVWSRYGTAFRAIYTMYEVTFAGNWPTNARPVIESVNPLFAIFYIGYITVIVFALIRVISALFLKDTLDAAQSDADLAVVDKKERRRVYVTKLEALFEAIDTKKSGMINEKQLSQITSMPNVHAYLETLGLDVKESAALFHLLDDGDGEVTREEFINGIMHCKGEARAIDQVIMHAELKLVTKRLEGLCKHMGCKKKSSLLSPMQRRQKAFKEKAEHLKTFRQSQSDMRLR